MFHRPCHIEIELQPRPNRGGGIGDMDFPARATSGVARLTSGSNRAVPAGETVDRNETGRPSGSPRFVCADARTFLRPFSGIALISRQLLLNPCAGLGYRATVIDRVRRFGAK